MSGGVALVKLGGSLLTDKEGRAALRGEVLERLADEIAALRERPLVLGHGSGSFGHPAAAGHRLADGLAEPRQLAGVVETQRAAGELHRHVLAALQRAGALPFSLPPSAWLVTRGGRTAAAGCEPVRLALARGLLPVVYGDVTLDRAQGVAIAATETVLVAVARALVRAGTRVTRAVWLGETDGVLDPAGATVERLDAAAWRRLAPSVGGSRGTDVTGGMRLRVETALALARLGIPSVIANGLRPGALGEALGAGRHDAATEVPAVA